MTRVPGIARSKLLIAEYGRVIGSVVLLVGLLSVGGAGWVYAHPPTTTVTDHTNQQSIESTLHTSALVTGESHLYRDSVRLRNQHIYLLPATPNVTLTVRTTTTTPEAVHLAHKIELVTQATNDGTVFWERSRVLRTHEATVTDGSLNSSTTVDIGKLKKSLEPIASEIGPGSSLSVSVRVTTTYDTNRYSGTLSDTAAIRVSGKSYSVAPLTLETTESTPMSHEVPLPSRDKSDYILPAGFGIIALVVAGFIGLSRRSLSNRDILADQVQRLRYSEWISSGTLPSSMEGQRVEAETLEDLIGVAIDTNKRVLFDKQQDVFAVIDGRVVYYYGAWSNPDSSDFEWVTPDE